MSPDDIRQDIEIKVVELLKTLVESGRMSDERSQVIAQKVLDTLRPGMTYEELYRAIPKLDDNCPEVSPVILPYMKEYEEKVTKKAADTVRNLIRQGQFDAATRLATRAIHQEVDLVWQGSGKGSSSQSGVTE
ncbi:hypothetical protein M1555_02015 [Patescibacteria group bacterium]|nr:hypothetical protein [Patescibacteria group bacterium]